MQEREMMRQGRLYGCWGWEGSKEKVVWITNSKGL